MKTLNQLLTKTPGKIKANAREVRILNLKMKRDFRKNLNALVFKGQCGAVTETVLYDITIELFPIEVHPKAFKKPSLDTDCFVKCSCSYFLFTCEVALTKAGSSEIDYSNGKTPYITNRSMIPMLCKHLVAAANPVVQAALELAKKDKDYTYI